MGIGHDAAHWRLGKSGELCIINGYLVSRLSLSTHEVYENR